MKTRTLAKILSMALALSGIFSISGATYAAEKPVNINGIVNIKPIIPNPFPWPQPVPNPLFGKKTLTPEKEQEFKNQKLELEKELLRLKSEAKELSNEHKKIEDELDDICRQINDNSNTETINEKEMLSKVRECLEKRRVNHKKTDELRSQFDAWGDKTLKYRDEIAPYNIFGTDLQLKYYKYNIAFRDLSLNF